MSAATSSKSWIEKRINVYVAEPRRWPSLSPDNQALIWHLLDLGLAVSGVVGHLYLRSWQKKRGLY